MSGNVARGHKATLTNPRTSAEAKEHSRQVLEELGEGSYETTESDSTERDIADLGGKDEGNVLRGHKAAINNPNVSEEAKEHSRQVLEDRGAL